jgi:wobble nucleotide-excising tRNase
MRITRLQKIKGYRIFRDFNWPTTGLPDFARFNIIYGWNGAGKTSLSHIFSQMQSRSPLTEGQVEVLINETSILGMNFDSAKLPAVRTFNRNTVSRNIFEVSNQQFPPVFFLGEDSVDKQKRVVELNVELNDHAEAKLRWERKKTDATTAYDAFCAEEAKAIKNLLTVAGGGPYNNYNATNFKFELKSLSNQSPVPDKLTNDQREQYLSTKDGVVMDKIEEPLISFPDFFYLIKLTQAMLERSVVSAVITKLSENPKIAAWVNAGLGLHIGDHSSSSCHFCDQQLPTSRINQLQAHFNNEFKQFQSDIDSLVVEITLAQNFTKTLQIPPKEALYVTLRQSYAKEVDALKQQVNSVRLSLDVLLRALKVKSEEPFKALQLTHFITNDTSDNAPAQGIEKFFQILMAGAAALAAATGKTTFNHILQIVRQHNKHTDSFDVEVQKSRRALAQHEVIKALPEWKKKSKEIDHAGENIADCMKKMLEIKPQIIELELEIRQHRRPAEELNNEISAYLGRDELRFEVEKNGYRMTRGGQPAMHLSDGERTAIAFLYFLKSLKSTDFNLEEGIVVIDDPVSSLDANSLFNAFSFMKQRTSTVGQLFILTHNFTFFRQVRNWYYNLPGQKKKDLNQQPARFYMLENEFITGERTAKLDVLDPFLHQYESEYHYLFKRVYEEAHKASTNGLESYYAIPNIARRLLEAFLAFRIPDKPGELFQKLECVEYDTAKKTRILRFLHTYSHFDQVTEPDHDPSVLSETPAILQEVLGLIRVCDPEHFQRMLHLVSQTSV